MPFLYLCRLLTLGLFIWEACDTAHASVTLFLEPNGATPFAIPAFDDIPHRIGDFVYFVSGTALWRMDGTQFGSSKVVDLAPVAQPHCRSLVIRDGVFYFAADVNGGQTVLYRSDTTPNGTYALNDPTIPLINPYGLLALDNYVVFYATNSTDNLTYFCATDGTVAGTTALLPAETAVLTTTTPYEDIAYNNNAYFTGYNDQVKQELFRTDGTVAGTVVVKDLITNLGPIKPQSLDHFQVNDELFYMTLNRLFATRGTADTVHDLHSSTITGFDLLGDTVITYGDSVYSSSRVGDNVVLLKYFSTDSYFGEWPLVSGNGRSLFTAISLSGEFDLCRTDGTSSSTVIVATLRTGVPQKKILPPAYCATNGYFYFSDSDQTTGGRLWSSNGNNEVTTVLEADYPPPHPANVSPNGFVEANGHLFFTASSPVDATRGLYYINVAPIVTSFVPYGPVGLGKIAFRLNFSEPVTGVTTNLLTVLDTDGTGTILDGTTPNGTTAYLVTLNAGATAGAVGLHLLDDNTILDLDGKPLTGLRTGAGSVDSNPSYIIEKDPPTATLALNASPPISSTPVEVMLTFSEPVYRLGMDALTVTRGHVVQLLGDGTTYTALIALDFSGAIEVQLLANACYDYSANGNLASAPLSFNYSPVIAEGEGEGEALDACGSTALTGQRPTKIPDPDSRFYISDSATGAVIADSFSFASGPIGALTWWGVGALGGASSCSRNPNAFRVAFYADDAGIPGTLVSDQAVTATQSPTGATVFGFDIWEYTAALPSSVSLTNGWLSIRGIQDTNCYFGWYSSTDGDTTYYQLQGSGTLGTIDKTSLSFCLYSSLPSEGEGEGEGSAEGEGEGAAEGEGEGTNPEVYGTVDANQDHVISLSELLRVIQFYNSGGIHCAIPASSTEDGYAPGAGDISCAAYVDDYNPQDWSINLSELLRVIQFYNAGGYRYCPASATEDGYCPGLV